MSLIKVRRAVNDVEKKQDDDPAVKGWLDSVKNALYDAEDLLDEINTENLRQKIDSETQSTQGVAQVVGGVVTSLDPFYEGVDSRIENIYNLLEILALLIEAPGRDTSSETCQSQFRISQTTHSMEDYPMYGRDFERELIIDVLQDGVLKFYDRAKKTFIAPSSPVNPVEKKIRLVAIVGMPGIGKTTLAKLIFDDERVTGKRLPVVLDDIRNEHLHTNWDTLSLSVRCAAPESTIIVAMQSKDIAEVFNPIITRVA